MTREEFLDFCGTIGGSAVDCPFPEDFETTALRHSDTGKWFGLLMFHDNSWIVNLKCEPMEADFLRSVYRGVTPAYHMNKVHWNSVFLESDVPDEEIRRMTMNSFLLTEKNPGKFSGKNCVRKQGKDKQDR